MAEISPHVPDYAGPCISNVVPAILEPRSAWPAWFPVEAADADQIVLLVLDGLGWEQLQDRRSLAPALCAMSGGAISAVAPSTTATALTSITTGLAPGEHGVVGYRMGIDGEVLNVLRWQIGGRDARDSVPPEKIQFHEAFGGQRPPVVTRAEFRTTGFTTAHLDRTRLVGWRMPSTLVTEVQRLLAANEPFVYAYYEGIDKVAHEYGLGAHYDAELHAVDRMVADIRSGLPDGAVLVVIADHGQVDVGDNLVSPAPEVMAHVRGQSGEGRFRWLHARPGHAGQLLAAAAAHHDDVAWVVGVDEVVDAGWLGPRVTDAARRRLGDVALVAREAVSFVDPADSGPFELIARHGSLTTAEMLVPLLVSGR
ncbi:MAG: alkaline phosphatase family protein [Acidimicrobiales bacterium]|nr:alkaline phosphatase family protein [Acidimicrobiales bacterium]